ncbi:MAG: hypothetical protein Q4E65_10155 [Clostridia bacterium]|nr:hypothetical protein [Clostridia bacterium]
MLQERLDNDKSTPKSDLILVIALLFLIIFARYILVLLRSLPYGGMWQLLILAGLIYAAYMVYKKRLIGYRYTLTYEEPAADDLDAFGERRSNPYPLGSFLVERMVADKGKVYEAVSADEYIALLAPGEAAQALPADKKIKTLYLTIMPRATAHTLLFQRENTVYKLLFSPSAKFADTFQTMLKDLRS